MNSRTNNLVFVTIFACIMTMMKINPINSFTARALKLTPTYITKNQWWMKDMKMYSIHDSIIVPATINSDQYFMKLAIRHAQTAYREREVPIGAVLVDNNGTVIAASRNQVEAQQDATAHAEVECLRKASKILNNWRLLNCTLYTTLEPCPMCLSAIQHFRVKRLVYGARDIRLGSCGSFVNLAKHPFNSVEITGGVLEEESKTLLKRFFQGLRKEKDRYASHDMGRGVVCEDFPTLNETFPA